MSEAEHEEHQWMYMFATLLHELGHVDDLSKGVNIDCDGGITNQLKAEVYANVFAFRKCYERGYYFAAEKFMESLELPAKVNKAFAEIVDHVKFEFQVPSFKRRVDVAYPLD